MTEFIIGFLRLLLTGVDIDIRNIIRDEDYDSRDRAEGRIKGRVWFAVIVIPFLLMFLALFMKTPVGWKILLFIPSAAAFIFFFRRWWKYMTGE